MALVDPRSRNAHGIWVSSDEETTLTFNMEEMTYKLVLKDIPALEIKIVKGWSPRYDEFQFGELYGECFGLTNKKIHSLSQTSHLDSLPTPILVATVETEKWLKQNFPTAWDVGCGAPSLHLLIRKDENNNLVMWMRACEKEGLVLDDRLEQLLERSGNTFRKRELLLL